MGCGSAFEEKRVSRTAKDPVHKVTLRDGTVRWRCVVDAGLDVDGRRRQLTRTFDTLKEARAFVASTRVLVSSGSYVGKVEKPAEGYTAYMVELTYPNPAGPDFKFTTQVKVNPDVLPFKYEPKAPPVDKK